MGDSSTRGIKRSRSKSPELPGSGDSAIDVDGQAPGQTEPQLEHTRELWFEDGNIILTTQNRGFKVYYGVLKQYSTYFQTKAPALRELDESDDGAKIMDLPSTWKYADVKNILMVFFCPNHFSRRLIEPSYQPFLASLLIMSQKMGISSIRKDVLRDLAHLYPTNIFPVNGVRYSTSDIVSIIHAVRMTDYEAFLPMAFYHLSSNSIEDIMALVSPEDNNVPPLSHEDLTRCLIGREKLLKLHRELWSTATQQITQAQPCKDCHPSFNIGTVTQSASIQAYIFLPSIFTGLETAFQNSAPRKNFCGNCSTRFWKSVDASRDDAWKKLPTLFKLPEWSSLREELDVELGIQVV